MASDSDSSISSPRGKQKKTKILFECWVTDPVKIDFNIYRRWIQGYDEEETVKKEHPAAIDRDKRKAMKQFVRDQHRAYILLESFLLSPQSLAQQFIVQIHPSSINQLVELYYSLNDEVLRDLLGRKLGTLSSGGASIEQSEGTSTIRPRVVKRQHDNIHHIYRFLSAERSLSRIQKDLGRELHDRFLLSEELSKKYLYIVFLCHHRFETNKKRLAFLHYPDYEYIASVLLSQWCVPLFTHGSSSQIGGSPGKHKHKNSERSRLDLDSYLVEYVRDMKPLLLAARKDETLETYLQLILVDLRQKKMDQDKLKKFRSKFIVFFKTLLNIGGNLSQSKEFRDFFIDIERAVELIREKGIDHNDIKELFSAMGNTFQKLLDQVDVKFKHRSRLISAWARFLEGMGLCIVCVYKAKTTQ